MTTVSTTPPVLPPPVRSRLHTEFGAILETIVRGVPGATAAVLSDDEGEAIDFAHRPDEVEALDVQLLGAQIGQAMLRTETTGERHDLRAPLVLVEAAVGAFVATTIHHEYILALLLRRRANVARALEVLAAGRSRLGPLLG